MKLSRKLTAICAVTGLSFGLTFGVHAAGSDAENREESPPAQQQFEQQEFGAGPQAREQQEMGEVEIYEASGLHGIQVQCSDGGNLGTVESVAVDLQGESPSFIVVETGGMLGIGADLRVVPFEAIEIVEEDGLTGESRVVRVQIEGAQWEAIPTFEADEIARLCEPDRAREIYEHYNIEWQERRTSEFGAPEREDDARQRDDEPGMAEQDMQEFEAPDRGLQEEPEPVHNGQQTDPAQDRDVATPDDERADAGVENQEGFAEERNGGIFGAPERDEAREAEECKLVMSRELEGVAIHDTQEQEIGQIDDLVINVATGQVQYVLIAPDTGFLERTGEVYAVAPGSFQSITSEEAVIDISSDELEQAEVLTQNRIQEQAREEVAFHEETQVFRYERDQIEFGRPDRRPSDDEEVQDNEAPERMQHQDQEGISPRMEQEQPGRPGVTPSARDAMPPPHTSPDARDRETMPPHTPPPAREPGAVPPEREPGAPPQVTSPAVEPGQPPRAQPPAEPPGRTPEFRGPDYRDERETEPEDEDGRIQPRDEEEEMRTAPRRPRSPMRR